MATYAVRQKLMSFGDDFTIRDEAGKTIYTVHSKLFTYGADLRVKDAKRNTVARIRQKLFTFRPTFVIWSGKQKLATIRKSLMTIRPHFEIDTGAKHPIKIVGDFVFYDYTFYREDDSLAQVSKQILSFTDSYGIRIEPGENDLVFLCASIVIDAVLHPTKKKK